QAQLVGGEARAADAAGSVAGGADLAGGGAADDDLVPEALADGGGQALAVIARRAIEHGQLGVGLVDRGVKLADGVVLVRGDRHPLAYGETFFGHGELPARASASEPHSPTAEVPEPVISLSRWHRLRRPVPFDTKLALRCSAARASPSSSSMAE